MLAVGYIAFDLILRKPVALRGALQLMRAPIHGFFFLRSRISRSAGRRLHGVLHFLTAHPLLAQLVHDIG